jgi:hypothetical protein
MDTILAQLPQIEAMCEQLYTAQVREQQQRTVLPALLSSTTPTDSNLPADA